MTIICPHCGFSAEVSSEHIPDHATEATCPRCKASFALEQKDGFFPPAEADVQTAAAEVTCPACGHLQPAGSCCIACGIDYAKWRLRQEQVGESAREAQITCPFCGNTQQPASFCQRCGGALPTSAISTSAAYAGFWIRAAAASIDSIAVWILQIILTIVLGAMAGLLTSDIDGDSIASVVILALFSSVVGIAYYVVFTGSCGQTPGKMLLHLKVVRSDGSAMTYGRAALREILGKFVSGITLGVGYLMVVFDARKQGLHDKIADTCVLRV
jgi:uncharacterized RDD family membrane protein YckC/DNA-directed RNA polymerase subunit M/transcription elongation factor TFIIS